MISPRSALFCGLTLGLALATPLLTEAKGGGGSGAGGHGSGGGSGGSFGGGGSRSAPSSGGRMLAGIGGGSSFSSSFSASSAARSFSTPSFSSSSSAASSAARTVPTMQGAVRSSYVPPTYRGPVMASASGASVPRNGLTTGYPVRGIAYGIPIGGALGAAAGRTTATAPRPVYPLNRPYYNTYPAGYSLIFIPYCSPAYSGYHWGVYDQSNNFYGFDDGDTTAGYYDYHDELPAGCQHSNEEASTSAGAVNLVGSFPAPAGAPALPPDQAAVAAKAAPAGSAAAAPGHEASAEVSLQALAPGPASMRGSSRLAQILCKPVPAKQDTSQSEESSGYTISMGGLIAAIVVPTVVIFAVIPGIWAYLIDARFKPGQWKRQQQRFSSAIAQMHQRYPSEGLKPQCSGRGPHCGGPGTAGVLLSGRPQ